MIIYEKSIADFEKQCSPAHRDELIAEIKYNLQEKLGRGVSLSEERSWRQTLVQICKYFEKIRAKNNQYILLEFKVPTTLKRIDVMLIGSNGKKTTLLIMELKGWSTSYECDIKELLKIDAKYRFSSHPNYQSNDYKFLLTERFSDVNTEFSNIECISVLPNYIERKNDPIKGEQFKWLLQKVPMFLNNDSEKLINYLDIRFKKPIEKKKIDFLNQLEYKPSIDFKRTLEKNFEDIKLSDSQHVTYRMIVNKLDYLKNHVKQKSLIIISGMPGSGKTIVAFKTLAYIEKNGITAKLQLPGPEFRESVKKIFNTNIFNSWIGGTYSKGEQDVIIIDEAHKAYGHGTCQQYYNELFSNEHHDVIIVLIDDSQVVNKKGFTLKNIVDVAKKYNWNVENQITLHEQFRNGADCLYIEWLKKWIFNNDIENLQDKYVSNTYNFEILNDKKFHIKYEEYYKNYNTRMASFWTQPWNAGFNNDETIFKKIKVGSKFYCWNPNEYWIKNFKNNFPNQNLPEWFKKQIMTKNFINEKIGSEFVAYFNTIQGSEFDYIFVHLPKLFFLNSKSQLDVDLSQLKMSDMKSQVWTKNNKPDPEREEDNKLYFKNRLLVNLTRGTKGTFIFCEDKKLANWINNKLIKKFGK